MGNYRRGRPFYLSDGSMLFLAAASCAINVEDLEHRGIESDFKAEQPFQYSAGEDLQLFKAVEVAVREMRIF